MDAAASASKVSGPSASRPHGAASGEAPSTGRT